MASPIKRTTLAETIRALPHIPSHPVGPSASWLECLVERQITRDPKRAESGRHRRYHHSHHTTSADYHSLHYYIIVLGQMLNGEVICSTAAAAASIRRGILCLVDFLLLDIQTDMRSWGESIQPRLPALRSAASVSTRSFL